MSALIFNLEIILYIILSLFVLMIDRPEGRSLSAET
jgi:hypothetical protein